jgi:membrane glycosyltransferase
MILLAPIIALTHTIFMTRLFVFRRGGAWNSQMRQSHAVPWRLAAKRLWPQTIAGCTVLGVVALKSPNDFGFALMGTSGLILAAPFAVATASPLIGALFAKIGIGRIPEENLRPAALMPLCLPALEARSPMAGKKTNKDHV